MAISGAGQPFQPVIPGSDVQVVGPGKICEPVRRFIGFAHVPVAAQRVVIILNHFGKLLQGLFPVDGLQIQSNVSLPPLDFGFRLVCFMPAPILAAYWRGSDQWDLNATKPSPKFTRSPPLNSRKGQSSLPINYFFTKTASLYTQFSANTF